MQYFIGMYGDFFSRAALRPNVIVAGLSKRWNIVLNWTKRRPYLAASVFVLMLLWLFCLPRPLFQAPFSNVLEDRNGNLLGARIALDGQWRFPPLDTLPEKYTKALICFEDKRFWYHPGVDPISLTRAVWQNLSGGKVVSGGSTLTMQVIRMARQNRSRNIWQKLVESFMATRLELTYSKSEILRLYAAHAPFGGNVVGIEAASWRYYGKTPVQLSWAEAATLAVLPNSPALIHPGRKRDVLKSKRDRLLERLRANGVIGDIECDLAQSEPLPDQPLALPMEAPHLLDRTVLQYPGKRFKSSLRIDIQQRVTAILTRRNAIYSGNQIHNLAAVVMDTKTGEVLAYIGNVPGCGAEHGENVDIITAPRSTGSILKPYLYAFALESGDILPNALLTDVPTQLGQYKPENFHETYDGAVPARRALVRSLNVPFVLLLQSHGLEKFHFELQKVGLTTITKPPAHYGLSLILGGAEANLLDLTNAYACMARRLGQFYERNGKVATDDFRKPTFQVIDRKAHQKSRLVRPEQDTGPLSPGSIWYAFEAMQQVERPNSSGEWELFQTSRRIAWKTGTSFGFRDAWAIGADAQYAVGVWVGNADGEGRPGLVGVEIAAPVLFEIFSQLPGSDAWFDPPYDAMTQAGVCLNSGQRAGQYCPADTVWIPVSGLRSAACRYHHLLHLDATGQWQVNSQCESPSTMQHQPWFVLPPMEEVFFRGKNPAYVPPPPFRADCQTGNEGRQTLPIQIIYPRDLSRIYVPVELDGKPGGTVFQAAHRRNDMEIFWHLDGEYLGATRTFHQMSLHPPAGKHKIALVDREGNRLEQEFEVIGK